MIFNAIAGVEKLRALYFEEGDITEEEFWYSFGCIMMESAGFDKEIISERELYMRGRQLGQLIGEMTVHYKDPRAWDKTFLWLGKQEKVYIEDPTGDGTSIHMTFVPGRLFTGTDYRSDYIPPEFLLDDAIMLKFSYCVSEEVRKFPVIFENEAQNWLTNAMPGEDSLE